MPRPPVPAFVSMLLLRINALLWLAFGVLTASGAHPGIPDTPLVRWGLSALALGCGVVLLTLDHFLRRHSRVAYFGALALLSAIAISLLADQFGLPDLVVLVLTVVPIILLVRERGWFLQRSGGATGPSGAA